MRDIFGNTLGLKANELRLLRNTYHRRTSPREIVSPELARHLTELSMALHRQIGILINRKGDVESVVVGNAHRIDLPEIGRARAGQSRLRGLRLVHTHLKSEPLTKDDLTDLALLRLDMVAAIGVLPEGLPGLMHLAHLVPDHGDGQFWRTETLPSVYSQPDALSTVQALEEEFASRASARTVNGRERAILVAVGLNGGRAHAESSLWELSELARTAGLEVLDRVIQVRREPDPRYLVGRGKLEELNLRSMQLMADVLIFDKDLNPSQSRHIAEDTSLKILDRTQLILDIFAQRAQSADGKLQVELAQLKYLLPRLSQSDDSLSRLAGGIGGRGPGETKLEIDRGRVRDRITHLEKRIELLSRERGVRRARRNRREMPVISIVGYTNAGKSTLLNALTGSNVVVENKLFATLDPTSRRLRFPREREVIVTDTVGLIRDLPKDLVNAFRATLEELGDASLLLHVVDASDAARDEQVQSVESILRDLDLQHTPRLMVWNKADQLSPEQVQALLRSQGGVAISARDGTGLRELMDKADRTLFAEGFSASLGTVSAEPSPRGAP